MTHTASEVFTMQLARAAGKAATRYLKSRGLQPADRDDITAAAMLWCWENRANYSLTTTLETWVMNAVRNAYQDFRRGALPPSEESIESIGGADETYNVAAAESAASALVSALTPAHKTVAILTMRGYTREEMTGKGISKRVIDEAHQRIRQLRRLLTDTESVRLIARTMPLASDNADDRVTGIDAEIERLDFPPPAGKECPPCWRCLWYYGFMPSGTRSTRMEIVEPEVREAVKSTEQRKIEIAQQVRKQ